MHKVKTYHFLGKSPPVIDFLDGLEPKLREKLNWQIYRLSQTPPSALKEPHYKHFSNDSQQEIKTYTVSPETDPQELMEEPFTLEGYLYTYSDIITEENRSKETVSHWEAVTVETSRKALPAILEKLSPTLDNEKAGYAGTLALDHTTLRTEEAGYISGSRTLTATKTIGPLDRNDMSYSPATTVKGGRTLSR